MAGYQGLSTLEVLEGADNYNQWIAEKMLSSLKPPVIEIGAGIGNISKYLLKKKPLYITDVDSELVKRLKKELPNDNDISIQTLDITKKPPTELVNRFLSVVAVNVLEHIEDDDQAVKHMASLLKKDGKMALLVPAKKKAYTRLDKSVGHYRRYEKDELKTLLEKNGLTIISLEYFNIVGLLSWVVRDRIERNHFYLKPYQIKLFDWLVPFLKVSESIIKIPVGISLIAVAQKK